MNPNKNNPPPQGTDRKKLGKGVKYLAGSLLLAFLGPSVVYSALGNQDKTLFIPILIIGVVTCLAAGFCIFKGIQTIMRAIFND